MALRAWCSHWPVTLEECEHHANTHPNRLSYDLGREAHNLAKVRPSHTVVAASWPASHLKLQSMTMILSICAEIDPFSHGQRRNRAQDTMNPENLFQS